MAEPFIHLSGVKKVYRTGKAEFLAVSQVTFDVAAGELVALVGPSGCGKTTLLKILAGLHPIDSGEVRLGSATQPFDPSRDIGMVFQQPLLLKWRRVIDNVLLPAEILGLPIAESRERANHLLALVGLQGSEDKYPYQLSGGMQQRAAIARALIHDPKLILMDEPFGALDAQVRWEMQELMIELIEREQKTVVAITHDIEEAIYLADRIIFFTRQPGRVKADISLDFKMGKRYRQKEELITLPGYSELHRRLFAMMREEIQRAD
jgi:NitT/TauT family transport system ATP-binding protein